MKTIIDTNKKPFIPKGWKIELHRGSGKLKISDLKEIELYLDDIQKDGKYIKGNKLREKLEDKLILNAIVLDYLLKHQDLIPEDWKDKFVYFWGTIYRDSRGGLYVRCLYWSVGSWNWSCHWLGIDFDGLNPAAVLQVSSTKSLKSSDLELRILDLENDMNKLKKLINL